MKVAGGTWTSADTTNWSTTTGGGSGASVPGSADTAIFDNNSGTNTITTNYNASLAGLTLDTTNLFAGTLTLGGTLTTTAATSLFSGTFNSAGFAMTCLSITGSSANTRTINITNSTINLTSTAAATLWNMATVTGLTFTATGSTINYTGVTANARTFNGGTGSVNTYGTIKISAGTGGITFNNLVCTDLDFTGFTGNLAAGLVANIMGSMTLGTGMTTSDSANAYTFSSTSGTKTITSNSVQFNHPIIFDGVGGTWQLADAIAQGVRGITVTNGTFLSNTKGMNISSFNSNNSNTRTVTLDSSTITLTGTGTISNLATVTGLTLSTSGTIWVVSDSSATGKTINWGTGTWGTLKSLVNTGVLTLTGPNPSARSYTDFQMAGGQTLTFGTSSNNSTAITGTPTFTTGVGNVLTINTSAAGTAHSISKSSGVLSFDYLSLQDSAATGGAMWYAGANSTNVSGNTGWNFTPPPVSNSNLMMMGA